MLIYKWKVKKNNIQIESLIKIFLNVKPRASGSDGVPFSDPHCGRGEPTPKSCHVISTCMHPHEDTHTHTHAHDIYVHVYNKKRPRISVFCGWFSTAFLTPHSCNRNCVFSCGHTLRWTLQMPAVVDSSLNKPQVLFLPCCLWLLRQCVPLMGVEHLLSRALSSLTVLFLVLIVLTQKYVI